MLIEKEWRLQWAALGRNSEGAIPCQGREHVKQGGKFGETTSRNDEQIWMRCSGKRGVGARS